MKTQVRRIQPEVMGERKARDGDADSAVWMIEEFDAAEPDAPRRTAGDRWICLVIAALGALTGFGFVGRLDGSDKVPRGSAEAVTDSASVPGSPRPAVAPSGDGPGEDASLRLISPIEAATIERTVVDVEAVASRKLGTVHLAVMLGGVALGRADVDVLEAGPFSAQIPVFAPPVRVEVELVATADATSTRRTLCLHPGGVVGLWPAGMVQRNGRTNLAVAGYAPMAVGHVQVRVLARDGRLLATATADVRRDETEPGSVGGYAIGLGSFRTSVALRGSETGALLVVVDWRDAVGGQWGAEVQPVIDAETGSPSRRRLG